MPEPGHQGGYGMFSANSRAVLILWDKKCIPQYSGREMSAKRLAVLVVPVLVLIASAVAQINEVSITAGRTFVSTQAVRTTGLPVHFGNEESVAFNYARM